jgi:antitoxin VapB
MSLNIKNEKVESLIRLLVEATGDGITEAIGKAVEEKLGKLQQTKDRHFLEAELLEIAKRNAARKVLDARSADEILGYDSNGLPTHG